MAKSVVLFTALIKGQFSGVRKGVRPDKLSSGELYTIPMDNNGMTRSA